MKQGKEYINGQYVYRYMQQGAYSGSKNNAWSNIYTDGWGVQLANKNSSADMTSLFLSMMDFAEDGEEGIIKEKQYMTSMFGCSKVINLDLSSFDISKVTDINGMFNGTKATTGYVKDQTTADKFNDSNVTNIPSTLKFTVK